MPDLYFKRITATPVWNDVSNWFTDNACTTQAANVPWVAGDSTYLNYDLVRSSDSVTAQDVIIIDADIGENLEITGICSITIEGEMSNSISIQANIFGGTFSGDGITNTPSGTIYGGTFSGNNFTSEGVIEGGTFSGLNFTCYNSTIYGGTFSGAFFTTSTSYIYGGIFSGNGFTNDTSSIFSGTFSGEEFTNSSGGIIYGGVFSGLDFYNSGAINGGIFYGNSFENVNGSGTINSGTFSVNTFINDHLIYGGTFSSNTFTNNSTIYYGFWLESGSLDIDIFNYPSGNANPTVTGTIRIHGKIANPYPYNQAVAEGFMTFNIAGQDVLGGGIL